MAAVETALDIDADAVKFCEVLKELQGHSESRHAVFNVCVSVIRFFIDEIALSFSVV
eukprot:m.336394 g.336394  ORF g.336394 m.336394 type:complete len:57 (-) comp20534_c0_seq4:2467-2637(-)